MKAIRNADGSFVVEGKSYPSVNALERAFGFPKNSLRGRLKAGWSIVEALTRPLDAALSTVVREGLEDAKARNGARRQTPNSDKAQGVRQGPICDVIRSHLADKQPRDTMQQRKWWATLGHYYNALKNESFTTETGATQPGFYKWLEDNGLTDFASTTVKATIDLANRWDDIRKTPVWNTNRTHPTDLLKADLH